ncbi:MAG: hypothetical protein AAFW00_28670, partial [Bacteroidota bacterium]
MNFNLDYQRSGWVLFPNRFSQSAVQKSLNWLHKMSNSAMSNSTLEAEFEISDKPRANGIRKM